MPDILFWEADFEVPEGMPAPELYHVRRMVRKEIRRFERVFMEDVAWRIWYLLKTYRTEFSNATLMRVSLRLPYFRHVCEITREEVERTLQRNQEIRARAGT